MYTNTIIGFIPSTTIRYLQLLLPVLRFVLTLMTTSGPQQKEASSQVRIYTHVTCTALLINCTHMYIYMYMYMYMYIICICMCILFTCTCTCSTSIHVHYTYICVHVHVHVLASTLNTVEEMD